MRRLLIVPLLSIATPATAQAVQPGHWDVTSRIVDLAAPGVPQFLQQMARGHSSAEHKLLSVGQEVGALLAPDPKAKCVVDSQQIANGRYAQVLSCPQKQGEPLHVTRSGTYDASGFAGQATVTGMTSKGELRIVLNQRATRTGTSAAPGNK